MFAKPINQMLGVQEPPALFPVTNEHPTIAASIANSQKPYHRAQSFCSRSYCGLGNDSLRHGVPLELPHRRASIILEGLRRRRPGSLQNTAPTVGVSAHSRHSRVSKMEHKPASIIEALLEMRKVGDAGAPRDPHAKAIISKPH